MHFVGRRSNSRGFYFAGQGTSGKPTEFHSEDAAAQEAERRAQQKPGQEWFVLSPVGSAKQPEPTRIYQPLR